ncbi:MAG TPA: ACT domain-containing protein [Gemmataceae bacterium]|nr:ACT domain-containing protein [Gemmataceae bacterium]
MPTSKQISVFLENKPGRLANVLLTLARERVNITALTVMDSHEHSVLRFVADDLDKTRKTLKDMGTPFAETEVLLVELRNQPGELAHVCELLGAEHVNIEYAYCSSGGRNGKTLGIFRVSNALKAMRVIGESPNNSVRRRLQQRPLRSRQSYQPPGSVRR